MHNTNRLAAYLVAFGTVALWGCSASENTEPLGSNIYFATNCGGVPQAPSFSSDIDALASYQGPGCDPTEKPGVAAFRDYIMATYPCTADYGIVRDCDSGGTSEHHEGRAWDWGTTPSIDASRELLDWLLAADEYGNKYAMARRFGIMYMIFDHQIWEAYRADKGWRSYSGDNPHTDHVHFSFGWDGAMKRTSFWTGSSSGGTTPPQPTKKNFIGGSCADNTECSSGSCLVEGTSGLGFLGGMCTEPCDMHCPDKSGEPTTYCVGYDVGTGVFGGDAGYCFSGCDTSRFPGSGCRAGFECQKMSRHKMSDSVRSICVPTGSSSINPTPTPGPTPPSPPTPSVSNFVGSSCDSDDSCSTEICLYSYAEDTLFEGGMCSMACDDLCPDKSGAAETFCVTFDPASGLHEGDIGYCFSRCDKTLYPGTGCRSGYSCVKMERHNDPDVMRNVCVPSEGGTISYLKIGQPADAEGDQPNPEHVQAMGCSLGAREIDPSEGFVLFALVMGLFVSRFRLRLREKRA
jgi:hypothetical protein